MFGKASIKTVPKDSLLSQRYKTWKSCCFSSIITWFDNLNSSDTKGFLILKIRVYLFSSRMYKIGVTDDCECSCWTCISESCYPSLFLKLQLETVLLWLIFMAKTEWNSVITKIVSEFQFCVSCHFLNLEHLPSTLKLLCCLHRSYWCARTVVKRLHEFVTSQESQLSTDKQGDKIKDGLLLISPNSFPSIVWFLLRVCDGQKTHHLLPERTDPSTLPLLTWPLNKLWREKSMSRFNKNLER